MVAIRDVHVVANLAFQRDVRDQALHGFRVHPRQIAGIGVAVGVAVLDIEEEYEIVAPGAVRMGLCCKWSCWSVSLA